MTGVDMLALRQTAGTAQGEKMTALIDTLSVATLTVTVAAGIVTADGVSLAGLQACPGAWSPSAASASDPASTLGGLSLDRFELNNP